MSTILLHLLTFLCLVVGRNAYFHPSTSRGICNIQRQKGQSRIKCSSNGDEPPKRKIIRQQLPKDLPMKTSIPVTGKSNSGSTVKSILMGQPLRTVRRVSPLDQLKYSLTDVGYFITNIWSQIKLFFINIVTSIHTNLQSSRMQLEERLQDARLRLLEWLREDDHDDKNNGGLDGIEKTIREETSMTMITTNDGTGSLEGDDADDDIRNINTNPISPEMERKELQRKANMNYAQRKLLEIEMLEKDNAFSKEMRENRRKARDTYAERKLQEIEAMERGTKMDSRRMVESNNPSFPVVSPISSSFSRTINTPISTQKTLESESNTIIASPTIPVASLNSFDDESPSPSPGPDADSTNPPRSVATASVSATASSPSSSTSSSNTALHAARRDFYEEMGGVSSKSNSKGSSGRSSDSHRGGTVLNQSPAKPSQRTIINSYDNSLTTISAMDSSQSNPTMTQSKSVMGAVGTSMTEYFSEWFKGVREGGGLFRLGNNNDDTNNSGDNNDRNHLHNNNMKDFARLDGNMNNIENRDNNDNDDDNQRQNGFIPNSDRTILSKRKVSTSQLLPPMSTSSLLSYARPLGSLSEEALGPQPLLQDQNLEPGPGLGPGQGQGPGLGQGQGEKLESGIELGNDNISSDS